MAALEAAIHADHKREAEKWMAGSEAGHDK
jgi:hypothetical protein